MFSKAVLTDDETNSIRDPAEVAGLGAISINMHKVKSIRRRIERKFNTEAIGPQQAIYERAKKVGAVQLSAGPVIQKRASPKVKSTYDRTVPVVIFKVHCVTRVSLQLLGYIPKEIENNSPCPAQKRAREEDEILAEETRLEKQLEELKRRRRVLGNAGSPANAGPSTQADESSFTIKAERTVFDFSQGGTADKPFTIDD
ncbi:hypothetical protein A4X03_0g8349 [Tilletia caries]|nr:hypothetical protein A4X03_0g8349 [Tilletia caries]